MSSRLPRCPHIIQLRPMLTTSTGRARCNALPISSVFHSGIQSFSLPAAPKSNRNSFVNHHLLYSSASSDNHNNNDKKNNGKRQRAVILLSKIKLSLVGLMRRLTSTKSRIITNFGRLSKKAKLIVAGYLMVMGLLLGFMGKTVYDKRTAPDFPINKRPIEITYSSFMDLVETQSKSTPATTGSLSLSSTTPTTPRMDLVKIAPDRISFRLSAPSPSSENDDKVKYLSAYTRKPDASPETLQYLRIHNVDFTAAAPSKNVILIYTLRSAMLTLYALFLWRMYQTMRGATGNSQQDVPGKLLSRDENNRPLASFQDIQGIDDAKHEVMELVDTLRNPEKYAILGARAPTGLLLEGPPGTGKTMLARATAATAGVPLLYCSGSDFIELYVGRGAGRVRRMFERAQKLAPCIIFIDELDTLGKARDSGNGMFGMASSRANDEAEQTLNQLLSCMDGLDSSRRICVLAATNRKDVLDQALIRPGRFDRIVTLKLPNANGRENILRVHAQKLPGFQECSGCDPDRKYSLGKGNKVDLSAVAAVTDGLSGAELEFIVNEAAIRAVRRVSAALRGGVDPDTITEPHVTAKDFEASVANFFETRRKNAGSAADVWKNVFKA